MGISSTDIVVKPLTMTDQKEKSVLSKIKSLFPKFNTKKKEKKQEVHIKNEKTNEKQEDNDIDKLAKNVKKLQIDTKTPLRNEPKVVSDRSDDTVNKILANFNKNLQLKHKKDEEDDVFTKKVVEDDRRSERIDSQSSEDSGFTDVKDDANHSGDEAEVKREDKGRLQKVVIARQPVKKKLNNSSASTRPYPTQDDHNYRQISQINKHTLTGGQVLVNPNLPQDNFCEVDMALKNCELVSRNAQQEQNSEHWQDVLEIIRNDNTGTQVKQKQEYFQTDPMYQSLLSPPSEDLLSDFMSIQQETFGPIHVEPQKLPERNPIEEFDERSNLPNYEECVEISKLLELDDGMTLNTEDELHKSFVFPTPPRSVPSPMSESQTSFYRPNSEYTLSPERSSPIYNSDYERCQDISPFGEFPMTEEVEKTPSPAASMTMKQFKDLQKDIAHGFSKKECCQTNRKSCKEVLDVHMQKLKKEERSSICFNVAKMDLMSAYGVLQQIILSLSRGTEQVDLQLALFGLICERVLAQSPSLFADDFGLSLLKSASLRCPDRPFLTRYLVHCIRTCLRIEPELTANKEFVFHEVDALGDNLLAACARQGDRCALVLSEILRNETDQPPLFKIHHNNVDGYTALHVACSQHSQSESKLHIVHVLLEHGGADIWKGDVKGGDTALHLAVNSANCDLRLILMIFKQIHRKEWKKLAHCHNLSSVTPLEYARSATKSTTRQNYPPEVLDFLKRCR